jgi:DNA-binding response OmpR family regulator
MTVFLQSISDPETHILIVDDEANIRSALSRALGLLGFRTKEAASGDEALLMLEHTYFDLMVLDMRMPGMHGIEVMQRVHRLYPELLLVVLTGYATLESAIEAVKSEAADYLLKPASIQEIVGAVSRSLQRRNEQRQRKQFVDAVTEAVAVLQHLNPPAPPLSETSASDPNLLHVPPLTLHCHKRLLLVANNGRTQMLQLTEGESTILASLMTCPDQILSCRDLIQSGWGYSANEREAQHIVRPHICRLRHKIEAVINDPPLIATVRKRGYVFMPIKP